jgi:hypothetical protein
MRLLLDECVDQRLRLLFAGHECHTAAYAGFTGMKNGALLDAAEAAGFEVIITTDQEIPFQQNLDGRQIAILILCAPTNRLADLKSLVPAAIAALDKIPAGAVTRIQ